MRHQACSNAQRFACACAAGGSQLRPIYSDFLFLPPRKIGNKALQKTGTASSRRCAVPFALHANTGAGANPEPASLVFFAPVQRIRGNPFGTLQARSRALPRATRAISLSYVRLLIERHCHCGRVADSARCAAGCSFDREIPRNRRRRAWPPAASQGDEKQHCCCQA